MILFWTLARSAFTVSVGALTHPWPQHAGVDRCLSGWGMCCHCLLRLLVESVSSFGRMDEDGFAPYLRTRCPWRLAATVGQASGAPALFMREEHSLTEDSEKTTFRLFDAKHL